MMSEERKYSLYIPQGLKTRVEIFEGFGKKELIKTIIVTIVAGIFDVFLYFILKDPAISVIFILLVIFGSIMMLTKDKNNISVIDQIEFMIKFAKSQKVYKYKYLDEWKI